MEKKVKWVLGIYCQWHEHKLQNSNCKEEIKRSDLYYPLKLHLNDVCSVIM